jgi:8-oxo-dGTP diphosphatase
VLLIRFAVPRGGETFVFWATPGGSVESGETDIEAPQRELKEELAIDVKLTGPVHSSVDRFTHRGVLVQNTDVFFTGLLDQKLPRLHATSDEERAAMQETKWWSCEELSQTKENVFPANLVAVVRRLT